MSESLPPPIHGLLEHSAWVRGLARTLVGDRERVDDLVQDTWVAAMERPPRRPENTRGWLATVLRNLVRQGHRAESRRRLREQDRAVPEAEPPAADVVARATAHRTVVDVVLGLEEPYRTVILLRFFEDLPPRRIADRLGVPVSTVHTRITRGLQLLRGRLRAKFGGDRAWLAAILPLTGGAGNLALPLLGAAVMKTKTTVLFGALTVTLGLAVAWPMLSSGEPPPTVQNDASGTMLTAAPGDEEKAPTAPPADLRRESQGLAEDPAEPAAPAAEASLVVEGRLLDAQARPLAGLQVGFAAGVYGSSETSARAATGAGGRFTLTTERRDGRVRVAEPGWTTVYAAMVYSEKPAGGALVVAAPVQQLAGRVVDQHGRPVHDAMVHVVLPEDFRRRFSDVSDAAATQLPTERAGEDGSFAFAAAPSIADAGLLTLKPGFEPDRRPLPFGNRSDLEIVLRRPEPVEGRIAGQVIDRHGTVVAGAWVAIGAASTMTDEQGNFALEQSDQGPTDRILAIKAGFQPGRYDLPAEGVWPEFVVVQLGEEPQTIRGAVVDAEGTPVPDVKVWAADPTEFGRVERGAAVAEGLSQGAVTMGDLRRMVESGQGDPREILESTPLAMWPWARTDRDGQFVLEGLSDRPYRLRVMVEETLLRTDTEPIPAGTDGVEIRLPAEGYFARVAGQVLSRGGVPVPGVRVVAMTDTTRVAGSTMHAQARKSTRTDESGRFELNDMPRTDVYLRLDGEGIVPVEYGRGEPGGIGALSGGNVEQVQIRVPLRMHVRVTARADEADALRVLDVNGRGQDINVFQGNGRSTVDVLPLVDGRSGVFVVPEAATTLVLLKNGEEVRRVDLHLLPGEVNALDL